MRICPTGLAAAAFCLGLPLAAQAAAAWAEQLSGEAEVKLGCDVAYVTHVVERMVDGKEMVMAKVHCMDQRAFDAVRFDKSEPFEFKECTSREKKSC